MAVSLATARLVLRPFTAADADLLVELDSDPAVMRYLTGGKPTPRTMIAREVLPRFIRSTARGNGFGTWAASAKASGDFVGWFGFQPAGGDCPGVAHLGYRLRRAAWGQGLATEGARALIHLGFTALGVERVLATTYQDNLASRRVMEKAGLRLVRRFRLTPAELAAAGTFAVDGAALWDGDDVEYALDRADWVRQEAERQGASDGTDERDGG
jgi:RimJ/RimL family protein N-acetyltransferase